MTARTTWIIPDNDTVSNAICMGPETLCGILMPTDDAMVGTGVHIEGSMDGTNFYDIEYEESALTVLTPETAATFKMLDGEKVKGIKYLRIVSQATETSGPLEFIPVFHRWQ